MKEIAIVILIILAICAIVINFISYKSYSDFIGIKYNRNTKHRKPARLTLKEAKGRYYPECRYAVVKAGSDNYPSWLCRSIEEAKEITENSCQSMYIVDLGDVR